MIEMKLSYKRKSYNYKYTKTGKYAFPAVFFIVLIMLMHSCTKADEFTTGTNFADSQTNLKIIDTFKVNLSTIMFDSLWTSGTKMAFVGSYKDEELGKISSSSFFELGFPTLEALADNAIYDSAAFVFSYSGNSYGDTTSLLSIGIHQLKDRLTLYESGYLYNTTVVPYDSKILGKKSFVPSPASADTLFSVPVNDFGKILFDSIQNNSETMNTSDLFLDYMKGFVISSESSDNKAIIGLTADANHISLKLYYHIDGIATETDEIKIPYGATDVQFNNIKWDVNNPVIKKIRASNNIVKSTDLGNRAYLHGLTGLLPKIQFPTLQDLFLESRWKILKAELIFEPVKGSYDNFKLPGTLYLYDTDSKNNINSQLYNSLGYLTSKLTLDTYFNEDTRYTFDITSFIKSEISDSFFDYEHGLLIGLNGTDLISTFGRMVIEGKNPAVKLRLYYLTY
jgi:hypothetical protein